MKTSTKSLTSKFPLPSFTDCFSKLTAVSALTAAILGSTFSSANAQDPHPGAAIFATKCVMCHGAKGEGVAIFPPLAESEWVNGPEENLVRIQLRGLTGPITVKGKEYNATMPPNLTMSDQEIADVLSYVRSNLGNTAPAITAETVKAIRDKEKGNTAMLTVKDLKPLKPAEEKPAEPEVKPEPEEKPTETAETTEPKVEPEMKPEEKPETPEAPAETAETAETSAGNAGQGIYKKVCAACHGQNGEGVAIFPPLAESEWVNGPAENLIRIQLHGLKGPIKVKGKLYDGIMPANAAMTNQEIADVLTYVRTNLGNSASAITPDMVEAYREEAKANPNALTAEDLKDPTAVTEKSITKDTELAGFKPAEGNGSPSVILWTLGIIGVCTLPVAAGLIKNS